MTAVRTGEMDGIRFSSDGRSHRAADGYEICSAALMMVSHGKKRQMMESTTSVRERADEALRAESCSMETLSDRAFRRFLETGDWSSAFRLLQTADGSRAMNSVEAVDRALSRAASRWHSARATLSLAIDRVDDVDRPVALADIALAEFERLRDWTLVRRLLERFRIGAEGSGRRPVALDAGQVAEALALAQAWWKDAAAGRAGEAH